MIKRLKALVLAAVLLCNLAAGLAVPAVAAADSKSEVCNAISNNNNCTNNSGMSIGKLLSLIVNILSWVIGVIAVIMLLVGGMRFVTAGGDSNNVAAARKTITYALVGLVVAAFAKIIVQFVLDKL